MRRTFFFSVRFRFQIPVVKTREAADCVFFQRERLAAFSSLNSIFILFILGLAETIQLKDSSILIIGLQQQLKATAEIVGLHLFLIFIQLKAFGRVFYFYPKKKKLI